MGLPAPFLTALDLLVNDANSQETRSRNDRLRSRAPPPPLVRVAQGNAAQVKPLLAHPEDDTLNSHDDGATRVTGRLVSRDEIVETALAIAERGGVEGVTMRILAEELGVSVATAYYHVQDKAELLQLMGEAMLAKVPCPPAHLPWDARLVTLSEDVRRNTARYPGLFARVPGITEGAEVERLSECTLQMLRDAGISEDDLEATLLAVATYTWGRLLLDALGREALAPAQLASSRGRGPAATAPPSTGLEILLDGIRYRASQSRAQR
jgi:AcrR family transcriptional regulator